MTFDGFDAALPIEAMAVMAGMPAPAAAEGWTLQDALREAGLAEAAAEDMAILDRRAARAELTLLDLRVEQGGRPQRTALDAIERAAAALVPGGDLASGKDQAASASSSPPGGGDYVDENGNGQWDPGEEILVNGTRPRTVDDGSDWVTFWSGGGGGDGGGDDGTGGGSGSEPEDEPNDCRDRHALDAKAEIWRETDHNFREHAKIIYVDAQEYSSPE
jgi:hypothetical protein